MAFLGAFFLWLALVAGSRLLVGVLPLEWAPVAAAADPLRRLEGFSLGLFDSASVAYFAALALAGLVTAAVSLERVRGRGGRTAVGRLAARAEAVGFTLAAIACLVAAVAFL